MFKKFSWGHGIILALASFILFILFMIFIFPNGQQNAEVVSENYYEDELVYQEVIDAKNNADALTEKPEFVQTMHGITVTFPKSIEPENNSVNFVLFRTNDSNLDIKKNVDLSADHSFTIPAKVLAAGSYTLKVKWDQDKKVFQRDYDVLWR